MKSCRVNKPRLVPLDVRVLGTIGATPVPSHDRTWARPEPSAPSPSSLHLPTQAGDLILQAGCLGFSDIALFAVSPVQRPQVTRDAGVDLLHPPGDLGHRVVLVAIVHRFELAAVNGN